MRAKFSPLEDPCELRGSNSSLDWINENIENFYEIKFIICLPEGHQFIFRIKYC